MSRSSSSKRKSQSSAKRSSKPDHSESNTFDKVDNDLSAVIPAEIIDSEEATSSADPSVHANTTTELAKTNTTAEALKKQLSHERKHLWMYLSALLVFLLMLIWFVWSQWALWAQSSPTLSPLSPPATTEKAPTIDNNTTGETTTSTDHHSHPASAEDEETHMTAHPSQEASAHQESENEPTQDINTNPVADNETPLPSPDTLATYPDNTPAITDESTEHGTVNNDGNELSPTTAAETDDDFTDDHSTTMTANPSQTDTMASTSTRSPTLPTQPTPINATAQTLNELQQQVQQLKQTLNDLQKQQQLWQQDLTELRSGWQLQWQVSQENQLNQHALVAWQQLQLVTSMAAFDTWQQHHQTLPTYTLPLPIAEQMQAHWQQWIQQTKQQAQFLTTQQQRIALWHELFHKPVPSTLTPIENTTPTTDRSGFDWQNRWQQLFKVTILNTNDASPHTNDSSIHEQHTLDDLFQSGLTALQDNHIQAFQSIVQQLLSLSSTQLTSMDRFQAQLTHWAQQGWTPQWPHPYRFELTNTHNNPTE